MSSDKNLNNNEVSDALAEPVVALQPGRDLPSPFLSGSHYSNSRLDSEGLLGIIENYVRYYAFGDSHTARAKRYDLRYLLEFLAGDSDRIATVTVSQWTVQSTKDFIDSRLALGEAPATVARRLATIKHMGRTLAERIPGYINPAREVKGPVLNITRPRGLDENEVELLREAAQLGVVRRKGNFIARRDQFLLELLLATGLRADEARLLVLGQITSDYYWLKNVKTKGRRYRNVYLDSEIRLLLQTYLTLREAQLLEKFPILAGYSETELARFPLLVSFYGSKVETPLSFGLSPKTVFNAIANLGKCAQGLNPAKMPNLHPHRLRHTFAHGLLDSSKDVRLVAQALGHSDVRTTMRYTERTDQELAHAMEEKRHRVVGERR